MRITIASVPTDSWAQNYYKTKRRRKSRIRGAAAKRRHIFSKDIACACAGRAYLLSKRKNEKSGKTRVASSRATGRVSMRSRGRANGMLGEASILWKVGWEMVET